MKKDEFNYDEMMIVILIVIIIAIIIALLVIKPDIKWSDPANNMQYINGTGSTNIYKFDDNGRTCYMAESTSLKPVAPSIWCE